MTVCVYQERLSYRGQPSRTQNRGSVLDGYLVLKNAWGGVNRFYSKSEGGLQKLLL